MSQEGGALVFVLGASDRPAEILMQVPRSLLDKPGLHTIGEALAATLFYATHPEGTVAPLSP